MMKEDALISVIVPVYNTETLLPKCIESIINQTYKNIEIILVNDGSTDHSLKICEMYRDKDRRIKLLSKENGGQALARNLGLDNAKGQYIGFVDSDDWILPEMYEVLLDNIQKYQAEISCCETIYIKNDVKQSFLTNRQLEIYNNYEAMKSHLNSKTGLGHSPVDKLYRRELFEDVRFLNQRGYEDTGTIFKLFMKANKVVYLNQCLYNYVYRRNSTMNKAFSELDFNRITAYKEMETYLSKDKRYNDLVVLATRNKVGAILYVAGEMLLSREVSFETTKKKLIDEINITLASNCSLSFKHKCLLRIIINNEKIYKILYLGFCKKLNKGIG